MKSIAYIAIRKSTLREWIDLETTSCLPEIAQFNAADTDNLIPEWAAANPVQRIGRFQIIEMTVD